MFMSFIHSSIAGSKKLGAVRVEAIEASDTVGVLEELGDPCE